jgi:hypothetical protein
MTQLEYTSLGLICLSYHLLDRDISNVLLLRVSFVPSLVKSFYSSNSVKSIGKYSLITDGVLLRVYKVYRSVIINNVQSGNNFVLALVPNESVLLADEIDYDFWHTALGYPFKINMNWTLYKDQYLIPDYLSTFTYNL